jgi:hypothetical protein
MWSKWLADTLGRASVDSRTSAPGARRQRVLDVETPADGALVSDGSAGGHADDWELVTGLPLHEGYGPVESEVEPEV